jgi:predicted Zn-dependent protease
MPLWLNEGLAEFYQNTDIHEKGVALGRPSPENILLLRQSRLLPLTTLFAVDHTSPYYHEETKGSIFYAESWALTHYLEQKNLRDKTNQLADYAQLLTQNVDTITAATRAFGDLRQLQATLEAYVRQSSFEYFKMAGATDVDDGAFQSRALATPQADAVRADFLAYNDRTADARALLNGILQEDPNNVLAHETMGFLEFRDHHLEEARNWYTQALSLDSQSYLAHYYFAAISMNGPMDASQDSKVESSLRASVELNPNFAPSYDRLAEFLAMRHRDLDEAHLMALSAVQLEPGNLGYRMDAANVLLQMERGSDAVTVIRNAIHLARSPQETAMAENFLQHAQEYAQAQQQNQHLHEQMKAGTPTVEVTSRVAEADVATDSSEDETPPNGPRHFVTGMLNNVHCNTTAMDLNVTAAGKKLKLHSGNYFKIDYTALGVTLKGNLNPCVDLEGEPAKVEYVDSAHNGPAAVLAVEIHK